MFLHKILDLKISNIDTPIDVLIKILRPNTFTRELDQTVSIACHNIQRVSKLVFNSSVEY